MMTSETTGRRSKCAALKRVIGARIRALRETAGMTQQRLADTLGMTRANLSYLESGAHSVGIDALVILCDVFAVTPDAVIWRGIFDDE